MKKLLVATAILLCSVAPAMASNFYGKGTLGLFSPSESALDDTFALYVAGGMNLKEQFSAPISAEVGLGYMEPSNGNFDAMIIPVTFTVLYELPLHIPKVVFNVGGGLGLYYWEYEVDVPFFGSVKDDGIEGGLHLQTGADFKLNDRVSLIGEVKWFTTTDVDAADIGGLSANAGVKLNF
jgi:hypothetical protein